MHSAQFLQKFKTSCACPHHPPSHQTGRGREDGVILSSQRCTLKEVHGGLKTHLLEGRAVGLNPSTVEGLVRAFKSHVVCYEGQVPVVNLDAIHLENIGYLLGK